MAMQHFLISDHPEQEIYTTVFGYLGFTTQTNVMTLRVKREKPTRCN